MNVVRTNLSKHALKQIVCLPGVLTCKFKKGRSAGLENGVLCWICQTMEEVGTKDTEKATRYAVPFVPSKRNLRIIKDKCMFSHFDFVVSIQVFPVAMYKGYVVPVAFADSVRLNPSPTYII